MPIESSTRIMHYYNGDNEAPSVLYDENEEVVRSGLKRGSSTTSQNPVFRATDTHGRMGRRFTLNPLIFAKVNIFKIIIYIIFY